MARHDAVEQYEQALKAGQKYYRSALQRGEYPYPLVLDQILPAPQALLRVDLGVMEIPVELVVGTRSAGRVTALAGNFMPLLPERTEFADKWIRLCVAQMDEGIRDPIQCWEYLGRFYVQEGNKRLSVLKSLGAPTVSAAVQRLVPPWSEDEEIRLYYAFLDFFRLARVYGVAMDHPRSYARLQAQLGFEADHVWTAEERRSFMTGYRWFREAFEKRNAADKLPIAPGEALLVWLQVFPFADTKGSPADLDRSLAAVWPDIRAQAESRPAEVSTQPSEAEKPLLTRLLGTGRVERVQAAFIYAFDPEESAWTRAHDHGRRYLERALGDKVDCRVYRADHHDFFAATEKAAAEGAHVIFATTPAMIDACRRTAALHREVRLLNCSLSRPYAGVRTYYSRTYESKFITGAIAGAMAAEDTVGYIANYPIVGVPADINAFALGVRLTNPRARVRLCWSCTEGDPLAELLSAGVTVISNRDATTPRHAHWAMDWGTYRLDADGGMLPLAVPCWNWGEFYVRVATAIREGMWRELPPDRTLGYWWGLDTGILDVQFSDALPEGVRALAQMLRDGISQGHVEPFRRRITDQAGVLRCNGDHAPTARELLDMDWLCDIVDGSIPAFDRLLPRSRELVRLLGVYRDELAPEKEAKQL